MEQYNGEIFSVWRSQRRPGPFRYERLGRRRQQKIGTAAVAFLNGPAGDARTELERTTLWALLTRESARTPAERILRARERTVDFFGVAVPLDSDHRGRIPRSRERSYRVGAVLETVAISEDRIILSFRVPDRIAATYLSGVFGLQADRIRKCKGCPTLFRVRPRAPNQRWCRACKTQGRTDGARAVELPEEFKMPWLQIRRRLDKQVEVKSRTGPEKDRIIEEALREIRRGARPKPWWAKWDVASRSPRPRGRPRKSTGIDSTDGNSPHDTRRE